jgi:hypothetical protein
MKSKSLSATNPYLKAASSRSMMARNIASSTAVETGKSSASYVKRYTDARTSKDDASHSLQPAVKKNSGSQKKSAS